MKKILGIDEAGRGPVIGPLIIAGVMIDENKQKDLGEVKDSKLLTHKKRLELDNQIKANSKYQIIEVSPQEIDKALESIDKNMNLNWLEAHKQAQIINNLKPDIAIIDCPHPVPKKFEDFLRNLLDNKKLKLIIEHKADLNYKTCAAASILAKVKREDIMQKIKDKYKNTGSGYPSDPKTKKFLKENWNKHPHIFRHSWQTYKNIEKNKNQKTLF